MSNIYILRCRDRIKVGYSKNVAARVRDLQTGASSPIEVYRTFAVPEDQARPLEGKAHRLLKKYKTQREWFSVRAEIAEIVLRHLIEGSPGQTVLAAVFKWLELDAKGGEWETQREAYYESEALSEQIKATGELAPEFVDRALYRVRL